MLTEEIRNTKGDHRPEGIEIHRAKCEGCCYYLTDGQTGHSRSDSHFRYKFIANYPTDHDTDAANHNRHSEQPPA